MQETKGFPRGPWIWSLSVEATDEVSKGPVTQRCSPGLDQSFWRQCALRGGPTWKPRPLEQGVRQAPDTQALLPDLPSRLPRVTSRPAGRHLGSHKGSLATPAPRPRHQKNWDAERRVCSFWLSLRNLNRTRTGLEANIQLTRASKSPTSPVQGETE